MADSRPMIVVPCYNEASRLDLEAFEELLDVFDLLFVDDGSSDATGEMLHGAADGHERIHAMSLPKNCGKAEAVRQGVVRAFAQGAPVVGYLDADLATPAGEMVRMHRKLEDSGAVVVLGSRVKMLGRKIERNEYRHWLGRLFATGASMVLRLPVYDTQCGAKLFRSVPTVHSGFSEPFSASWAFDVELLGRLLVPLDGSAGLSNSDFLEVPLHNWMDVAGSKLTRRAMLRALRDLAVIGTALSARR